LEKHPKITALAITLNEAANLPDFLKSLDFVDEIIIVDSFSTDNTVTIAKQFEKVTVFERAFDNFSSQKNYALSKASNDWVVFFDPDETITAEVKNEILDILKNPIADAYFIKRENYFMKKRIKYSGFQSDWVIRLFKKDKGTYNGNLVHETLDISGKTGKFKSRLPHNTYKGFDEYMSKLHRYSKLQAQMLYDKKKRPKLTHFFIRPLYRFWHQYLIRLGILDGKIGFILAYTIAFSVFKRYVNLWLLYRKIN